MSRIYRTTDRIPLQIDDLKIKIAPLSSHQKMEIQQTMLDGQAQKSVEKITSGVLLALKYGLKEISGLEDSDGNPYKLQFDEAGMLTDACLDDILNLEQKDKLILVCSTLANGVPSEFKLPGVSFIRPAKESSLPNE